MSITTFDKVISAADIHRRWGEIVEEIALSGKPYVVTERGKPSLVILSLEEYEELIDARLAESPLLQERLEEARANYERGEGGSYEALRQDRKKFEKAMAKVTDTEPEEQDRL